MKILNCPACQRTLRNDPEFAGMVLLCPYCDQAFVIPERADAHRFDLADRAGSYGRAYRVWHVRPTGVTAIAALGIVASLIGLGIAVLVGLSCLNAIVPPVPVSEEMREVLPQVAAKITRTQKILSAFVAAAFALVFLITCIGLLKRRESARRILLVYSWIAFAVFAGTVVGIVIMPDSSIKAWTLVVFLPVVIYFTLAILYLYKRDIRGWFKHRTPRIQT
ncbi:MAG: hypothetical protein JW810_12405 [Sedimentisphaerales bacterium]|nr:hypothetical protein [Sedimentisphaerales bacterium]